MPRKGSEIVDLKVWLIKETPTSSGAYLVRELETKKTGWVPKSQVELTEEKQSIDYIGPDVYILTCPTWLAKAKEWY